MGWFSRAAWREGLSDGGREEEAQQQEEQEGIKKRKEETTYWEAKRAILKGKRWKETIRKLKENIKSTDKIKIKSKIK